MNIDDIGNDNIIGDDEKIGDKNMLINTEEQNNNINEDENDIISNEKYMSRRKRGRKRKKETNEGESQRSTINKTFKRKDSIKWNTDLHSKFVEATQQLGEGSCLPKEILKGLEDQIIESMSHELDMMFKSWDPQDYSLDHNTQNDYNLNLNVAHVAYSGSATMSNNDFENATINGLRDANTNFQQYIGEKNMSNPSNVVMTLDASNINGSDSNEKENYELYFNFNNMDYLSQNLESPSATLLNKHGSEQTQVYSDDQVCASQ
ncbi:hypothetical protein HAX54_033221 [Datura stramonium]|uniref:Uncharacterized protein n=1 Tax=Datura stramonium TaxID=4076 RepID=A0ABS8VC64_DATST|nr:hypothetical protein [Datura stramonium]